MPKTVPTLLFVLLALFACTSQAQTGGQEYDLLITGGSVIEGSGASAVEADVLVENGVIVQVGAVDTSRIDVERTIDAEGRVVSPGFIDTHSHGDPLETPRFDNVLSMGVTTISLGQDGSSPGLEDVSAWMDAVDRRGTGPNIVHFAGHGTLRERVGAPRESGLDDATIRRMQALLSDALAAGSFGMTTGLEYDPGRFADLPELAALAESVSDAGGLVMSHIRNEDEGVVGESVAELLEQGRRSGADVHVSHIKVVFGSDPQAADELLAVMDTARNDGRGVTADVYPYTASYTGIAIVFPEWALPPNDYDDVVANRREELAAYLRNRVNRRNGPEATLFGTAPWAGKTLATVADELGKPFEDVLIDDIGPDGASAAYFVMDEDVMRRFLIAPHVMVSSDGSPSTHHARAYGAFARIIRKYVNEEELLSLEEAIHKMTGLPAETLGLSDSSRVGVPRGLIREGFAADLLVFDPAAVTDRATFEDPHRTAEGFDWVFVNGEATIEEGERNDALPGGVVRRSVKAD